MGDERALRLMAHTLADLRRKLLKLATATPEAAPETPPIVVNITMPDLVGDLLARVGDGKGGIRTSDRVSQVPG